MTSRSREFWEGRYRTAAAEGASIWGEGPNDWIAAQAAALPGPAGHALDLGAGEGRNSLLLAGLGWRVTAVDFAVAAVEGLRRLAAERNAAIDAVVGDVTTWRSPEPVELAVLCYLQLEPASLAAAIAQGAEALAPGGTLLGIWHDREDLARGLGGSMTPAIRTTPGETAAAADAAGLEVVLSDRRDRPVAGGLACDTLLVARAT